MGTVLGRSNPAMNGDVSVTRRFSAIMVGRRRRMSKAPA
jgi:hypothetical protein